MTHGPWRRHDVAVFALGLAIVIAFSIYVSDAIVLLTRPLWVDEVHTVLLASRPSAVTLIGDLASGADYGPPLFHLTVWLIGKVTGPITPTTLRLLSVISVWAALICVFDVLRRHFTASASVAGSLAVGAHALVITHAFEGRFYGPWLLCVSFFAWALSSGTGSGSARGRSIQLGAAAIFLCTIHWYGIITMVIMIAAALASYGRDWRAGIRALRPTLAGAIAFLACVPLALGQRHALTISTWVPDFTTGQLSGFARAFWLAAIPAGALVATALAMWHDPTRTTATLGAAYRDPGVSGLQALLLMPLVLAALSLLGQPSMLSRYGIVAVLGWAPLVALAGQLWGVWVARAAGVFMAALLFVGLRREATRKHAFEEGVRQDRSKVLAAKNMGMPVIFQSMHSMYAVVGANPADRSAAFLVLSDSILQALLAGQRRFYELNKGLVVERDVVRVHARRFGFPVLVEQAVLDSTRRFVLLVSDGSVPRGYTVEQFARTAFPHHSISRLADDVWLLERAADHGKVRPTAQNAAPR